MKTGDAEASDLPAHGVMLGVDVGSVRVGLAASDPSRILATPVRTLARDVDGHRDLADIAAEATARAAVEIVVGLPIGLGGHEGHAAGLARTYAGALAAMVKPVPVRLVDERLTTVAAHQALRASGRRGRAHRSVVDQAAAVLVLQTALDARRSTGRALGERVRTSAGAVGGDPGGTFSQGGADSSRQEGRPRP